MRTVGRKWPTDAPRGDYQAICDYCGVPWRRSQLRRDQAGRLACPDDQRGRDVVTLSRGNAAAAKAAARRFGRRRQDGGTFHTGGGGDNST